MAQALRTDSRMQLVFDNGVDPISGKQVFKTKSFNNVKTNATPDQILLIAQALAPLQQLPLFEVKRNDTEVITAD
ncbi:DUF1659 domain-containing protein [Gracilibacillus marinus]|jgi:hypothetical protein|uniref:DUF1659 domain-containing protein n=1 Tax=Gracilibacillus marinus TaxID=630535 RepID=A0ABV8VQU0_9BACI